MTRNKRVRDMSSTELLRRRQFMSRRRRLIAFAAAAAVGAATLTIIAPVAPGVGDPCNAIDPGAALAPSSSTTCVHSFTASGSWTVPVGVTSVDVLAVGGGGGGGGSYWESDFYLGAGGGGGGGQVKTQGSNSVTAGASLTIVIGTGGAGGPAQTTSAAGTGSRGGTTSMTNGTWTASAAGGMGGTNAKQAESLSGGNNGGNDQSPVSGGAGNGGAGSYSWPTPSTTGLTGNVVGAGGGGGGAYAAGTSATRTNPNPFTYATSAGGNGGAGSDQASNYAAGTVGIGGGGGAISQGSSSVGVATAGSGDTVRSSGTGGTTTVLRTSTAATYTASATAPVAGSTNTGGGGGGAALVATSGSSVASAAGASGGSGLLVVRYSPSVAFSDTTLTSLSLSGGSLTPSFASGTTSYTSSVSFAVASTTVTPSVTQPSSSVTVNGTTVVSGSASSSIPLTVGTNTVTVIVTAQDASTRTYTVTITRGAGATIATLSNLVLAAGSLSPSFSSGTTSYTSSVVNAITSTTVTPTVTDANATVTVNGATVASASASATVSLSVGSNTITVVVTAEDTTTTQTYTVIISRAGPSGGGGSSGGDSSTPTPTPDPSSTATLIVAPTGALQPVIETATQFVSPGSAVVLIGGVPTAVTLATSPRRDGVQVSGDGWQLDLAGTLPDGRPAPLDTNGTMRVVQGRGLATSGTGFAPNTEASIYIYPSSSSESAGRSSRDGSTLPQSAPLLLGTLTVGVDGTFTGSVPVPDTLTPGDFIAQVNGYTPTLQVRSASVGLVVAAEKSRVVKKVRATITFAAESSLLGTTAKAQIARLVQRVPRGVSRVTMQSIGYVQPSANTSNDVSLSTARAKNVMLAMRADGLRGRAYVSGRGPAAQPGPAGRRVQVVIAYKIG